MNACDVDMPALKKSLINYLDTELTSLVVEDGEGLTKGIALAERIAENAPLTNFAITHVLPRIAESDPASGYIAESLMAATPLNIRSAMGSGLNSTLE